MILDGRTSKKTPVARVKDQFAFRGLISCGHCGCALVGEIKKGRYVYYHCTGYKGKCPEPYTRQEVLENKFTELLKGITFSEEVLAWVTKALRKSHGDEKEFHDEAITRLRRDHKRIQDRIDAMYMDKLDGRIDAEFFDRQAAQWRTEQVNILRNIEMHATANQNYIEEGIKLLQLARRAHELFENQSAHEKRRLLDFVLSNSVWKNGKLLAEYRQPFDVLAVAIASDQRTTSLEPTRAVENENWLPESDITRNRKWGTRPESL
jgi:site-specific DNA recombinase